ncbi:MAG: amidohydrolase family protein [Verrucomicrobiales bacterium]
MKLSLVLFFLLLSWSLGQVNVSPVEGINKKNPHIHALVGGVIVTPEKEYEGSIVIRNGLIDSVGEEIKIPEDARVWDVTGKRIYPGFIESCMETALAEGFEPAHWNSNVMPDRKVSSYLNLDDEKYESMRRIGFCVIHVVADKGIFRGESSTILLREGKEGEQILSSDTGQVLDFDHGLGGYPSSLMGSLALVRQVLSDSKWYQVLSKKSTSSPSLIKRPSYNRALKSLDHGGRFFFITRDELDYDRIHSLKSEFGLNASVVGNGREYRRLDVLKKTRAPLIVPLNFPDLPSVDDPVGAMDYSLEELQHWEFAPSSLAYLAKEGIEFSLTSNKTENPEAEFWDRVRTAVKRGLDPRIALKALTTIPANYLGMESRLGELREGVIANIVVTEGDIFRHKDSKIKATWVEGVPYLNDSDETPDVEGQWEITFPGNDKPFRWEIPKGKKVKIKSGDDEDFPAHWKNDRLLLFPPSKLFGDGQGVTRMSASFNLEEGSMNGIAVTETGKTFWWNAKKVSKISDDKPKNKEIKGLLPELKFSHYPAGAYGVKRVKRVSDKVLFKNGTVWTSGPLGVIKKGSVLIEGGKIKEVSNSLVAPEGVRVIDLEGKHLTPGLIDCHSHSAISRGVNEGTHSVTVEVRISDSIDPTDISLYRQLGGGLTTANLLHGSANPMGGQNQVIKLRWGSGPEGLKFNGAKPGVKFALGENVKQSNWGDNKTTRYPQTRMGVEQIMKDSFIAAREYESEKQNAAKKNLPHRKDYRKEALLEILNGERIVHIHSYRQDEILMFVRLAQEFGFTVGTFQHVLEGYKVADAIAEIGAGGSTFSDWWAYKFEVYDAIPFNGALMQEMGVITSFNSDSSELACRMNVEAAKAVKYGGMSEPEALKFVTINPAIQLRIDERVGSIEQGKDADLVIWNGPPLSTYSKAEQTWIDGIKYFDINSDEELRQSTKTERNRLINIVMNERLGNGSGEKSKSQEDQENEKITFKKQLPRWIPITQSQCSTIFRKLYHNGQSLHTCTTNGCCK